MKRNSRAAPGCPAPAASASINPAPIDADDTANAPPSHRIRRHPGCAVALNRTPLYAPATRAGTRPAAAMLRIADWGQSRISAMKARNAMNENALIVHTPTDIGDDGLKVRSI